MIDYVKDLPRVEMCILSKERLETLQENDEKELFLEYKKTGDTILCTYLVYRNLGLVYHIANGYSGKIECDLWIQFLLRELEEEKKNNGQEKSEENEKEKEAAAS